MTELIIKRISFRALTRVLLFSLTLISLGLTSPAWAEELVLNKITLETESGVSFTAYVAGPEDSNAGVLLVHDWFGSSDFYREATARLGSDGYRVIAVDLYNGQSGKTHRKALTLMQALDADTANAKVQAGFNALKKDHRKFAIFGFSMGAGFAFPAAVNNGDAVTASVVWYGFSPSEAGQIDGLGADALFVYGSLDGPAADQAAAASKLFDAAGLNAEIYIYPQAHHAFAQPLFNAGETYDPIAAAAAWAVTEDFLERKLR